MAAEHLASAEVIVSIAGPGTPDHDETTAKPKAIGSSTAWSEKTDVRPSQNSVNRACMEPARYVAAVERLEPAHSQEPVPAAGDQCSTPGEDFPLS